MTVKQASADRLLLALSGSWKLGEALPSTADIQKRLEASGGIEAIAFDTQKLAGWDSGLLTFLQRLRRLCEENRIRDFYRPGDDRLTYVKRFTTMKDS